MYDYIPKADVITMLDNLVLLKHPEYEDSLLVAAYKKGYQEALEQVRMEITSKEIKKKTIKVKSLAKRFGGKT